MEITIKFLSEAETFLDELKEKERMKILTDIRKTSYGLKGEWFRKMPGTDDIWEFRTLFNKTYYRMFAFYDKKVRAQIICTNGIVKKSDKTPQHELEKAENLKRNYYLSLK